MSMSNVKKYTKNENDDYVCPHDNCSYSAKKQNTMHYHIMKKHSENLPLKCTRCDKQLLQRSELLQHLVIKHSDNFSLTEDEQKLLNVKENPVLNQIFKCPFEKCGHEFRTKGNTLVHYARTHLKQWIPSYVKNEQCTRCHKDFRSNSAYLHHSIKCFNTILPQDQLNIISRIR